MNFLDFNSLFDKDEVEVAIFSTYNFEPIFFENRLLHSKSLEKTRHIIVMMDAGQFTKIQQDDVPARQINKRYLVVPIRKKSGVFHAKFHLLLTQNSAKVICGSNNLSQTGCTHNLELVNVMNIQLEGEEKSKKNLKIVHDAFSFFEKSLEEGVGKGVQISKKWFQDFPLYFPWFNHEVSDSDENDTVEILHTFDQNLWDWLINRLKGEEPKKFIVISPYFDSDLKLLKNFIKKWPNCKIDIIAQQQTSNIPANILGKLGNNIKLYEVVTNSGRRLHAKLIAVETRKKTVCIAGSANFTRAAFEGNNVEVCLGMEFKSDVVSNLFNKELGRRPIKPSVFVSGDQKPPTSNNGEIINKLKLLNAFLDSQGRLSVEYCVDSTLKPQNLCVSIRRFREAFPLYSFKVPKRESGYREITLPNEVFKEIKDSARCFLEADVNGEHEMSSPFWLIQEAYLTHEASEDSYSSKIKKIVQETGERLFEFLDRLWEIEGEDAVIKFIQNVSVRFYDGASRKSPLPPGPHTTHDPTRSDTPPNWKSISSKGKIDLDKTICDFVKRHEINVLRKHAKRGNINGLKNFLDVFVLTNRLLYVYFKREIINKNYVIDVICRNIDIFTKGYIDKIFSNLKGNLQLIHEVFKKFNVPGHLLSALIIAQMVRWKPGESSHAQPINCLPSWKEKIEDTLIKLKIEGPEPEEILDVLNDYKMLGDDEMINWRDQIFISHQN